MNSFFYMFSIQAVLLIYILCGVICRKQNMITTKNQSQFIGFVLNILMPCMVFHSFRNVTVSILKSSLQILAVSFAICFAAMILGRIIYRNYPDEKQKILRYGILINNAGFAGLPLAQQVYGETGLIYASIFLIPIRIFMWSAGLTMLSSEKVNGKILLLRLLKNPNIIAVLLGITRGMAQISLPAFIDSAIGNMSACVSPLSMIIIGAIISDVKWTGLFEKGVPGYAVMRLMIIPLSILGVSRLFGMDEIMAGVTVTLSAMPAATSTSLLASQYHGDVEFASKLVFVTTVLSLVTAPVIMMLV